MATILVIQNGFHVVKMYCHKSDLLTQGGFRFLPVARDRTTRFSRELTYLDSLYLNHTGKRRKAKTEEHHKHGSRNRCDCLSII